MVSCKVFKNLEKSLRTQSRCGLWDFSILYAEMKDFKRTKNNPTIGMSNEEVTQYWTNASIEKFGDNFDYSEVGIISIKKDPCKIICKTHGLFDTSFEKHLDAGTGCPKCGDESCRNSKRMTFEEFLERLDKAHPNKAFKILSREFRGRQIKKEKLYTQDEFGICKANVATLLAGVVPNIKTALFPDLYNINRYKKLNKFNHLDFSNTEYNGALNYTTVKCRKHGEYPTKPNWILDGRGCPMCADEKRGEYLLSNTKDFVRRCMERFDHDIRIYDKVDYKGAKKEILIFCNNCNDYYKTIPNSHYSGYGCSLCEKGGYSREDYVRQAKGRDGVMYILKLSNNNEEFYKIGITFQGVKVRFSGGNTLPYDYDIVYEHKCDAGCIWDLEKTHHKQYKHHQYFPEITFAGYTECFNLSLPIDEIIENLKNIV